MTDGCDGEGVELERSYKSLFLYVLGFELVQAENY